MNEVAEVLCAGIVVADHICTPIAHLPAAGELVMADRLLLTIGGCAANVAVDLVRLGHSATVIGRVGGDVFGRVVAEMLRAQGVNVGFLQTSPGVDTSQTLIVNVTGEDRRFIHSFGANAEFKAADLPTAALEKARVLYVGGYLLMESLLEEELAEVFAVARLQGVKTVLDVVTPGPADYLARLRKLLPHVEVFLPNNHEAELITGKKDPLEQARSFHQLGVRVAIITLGQAGAVVVSDEGEWRVGTFQVPFVDGSGGGDAFAAGYISGLLQNRDLEGCLLLASALGASCVQAVGTTTGVFTRPECEEFLKQNCLRIEKIH